MIPLIVIALVIGIILGQFLGGALRAALIVAGIFVVLSFASRHGVDVRGWIGDGVKAGRAAVEDQLSTRAPGPIIKPGLREARWRRM